MNDKHAHAAAFGKEKALTSETRAEMSDLILSATAPEAGFSIVAGITTSLVSEMQTRHALSPTATAATGRLITAAALLATSLKGGERVGLQIAGDGPLRRIVAEAWLLEDRVVGARGYANVPHADVPLNDKGKFDVAAALGEGSLHVTKSYEIGQPYVGVVPLLSGEVAEDLASYLVTSEQIPSVVALGVLANPQGVLAAGGLIAQVLPGADARAVAQLEQRALAMPPVTELIAGGGDAATLLHALAGENVLRAQRTTPVEFACRCTREKVEAAFIALGVDELQKMANEREETTATCEFCKKVYIFTGAEVTGLATRLERA